MQITPGKQGQPRTCIVETFLPIAALPARRGNLRVPWQSGELINIIGNCRAARHVAQRQLCAFILQLLQLQLRVLAPLPS